MSFCAKIRIILRNAKSFHFNHFNRKICLAHTYIYIIINSTLLYLPVRVYYLIY